MKIDEISIGDVVWAYAPSIEADGDGREEPCWPRRFKVTKIRSCDARPLVICNGFCEETGRIDDDTNATIYVRPDFVYRDEKDAVAGYIVAMWDWRLSLRAKVSEASENIERAEAYLEELKRAR